MAEPGGVCLGQTRGAGAAQLSHDQHASQSCTGTHDAPQRNGRHRCWCWVLAICRWHWTLPGVCTSCTLQASSTGATMRTRECQDTMPHFWCYSVAVITLLPAVQPIVLLWSHRAGTLKQAMCC